MVKQLKLLLLVLVTTALVGSSLAWFVTLRSPRELPLLPGGDVAFGFYSHAGQLSWIEIASWYPKYDPKYTAYPIWSVAWATLVAVQAVAWAAIAVWYWQKKLPTNRSTGHGASGGFGVVN